MSSSKSRKAALQAQQSAEMYSAIDLWVHRHLVGILTVAAFLVSVKVSGSWLLPSIALAVWLYAREAWWARQRTKVLAEAGLPRLSHREMYALHRKHQQRLSVVREQWDVAMHTKHLTGGKDKAPPVLENLRTDENLDVHASMNAKTTGVLPEDVAEHADRIAKIVGCEDLKVTYTTSGCADLSFLWTDPLERIVHLRDLPEAPPGYIAYGIRADGRAAAIRWNMSVLIGGLTRHGKSNAIWTMLHDLNRQGIPVELYVSNPKGVELRLLDKVGETLGNITIKGYETGAPETAEMVDRAYEQMQIRQNEQKAKNWKISKESPLVIILLDELIPLQSMIKDAGKNSFGKILFTGAALGYVVWANAQIGHADVLGTMRNFIPQRICFATLTSQTTDTLLGTGAEARGAKCSTIRVPGVGYSGGDDTRVLEKFRGALVTDDAMETIALGGVVEGTGETKGLANPQHAVYRLYNAQGVLLYIGETNAPAVRFKGHASDKPWWGEVDHGRTVIIWHKDREEAKRKEREGIQQELPLYNEKMNGDNPVRWDWRRLGAKSAQQAQDEAQEPRQPRRRPWQRKPQEGPAERTPDVVQMDDVDPVDLDTLMAEIEAMTVEPSGPVETPEQGQPVAEPVADPREAPAPVEAPTPQPQADPEVRPEPTNEELAAKAPRRPRAARVRATRPAGAPRATAVAERNHVPAEWMGGE